VSPSPADQKTAARRLVEASAWRTHLTEIGAESSAGFEAWLAADSRNRDAWDRVQKPWDLFAEEATSPELLELRRKALAQVRDAGRKRWSKSNWQTFAIAAGVGIVSIAGFLTWTLAGPDVYRTGIGERRVVGLADGSRVQLDAGTELRVRYSERGRDLELAKGQARFDVARDVERPFSVLAAGQKVIATGTAFNVDLLGKDLFVTLIEGRVAVVPPPARAVSDTRNATTPLELTVGQQLRISAGGSSSITPANVQRATAWQTGRLIFDDEPLSSVIVRINRYAVRPLIVADERAASLKISGVFDAGDTDGFIATLTRYLPVSADFSDADTVQLNSR
jgi:transmembrane sensor